MGFCRTGCVLKLWPIPSSAFTQVTSVKLFPLSPLASAILYFATTIFSSTAADAGSNGAELC